MKQVFTLLLLCLTTTIFAQNNSAPNQLIFYKDAAGDLEVATDNVDRRTVVLKDNYYMDPVINYSIPGEAPKLPQPTMKRMNLRGGADTCGVDTVMYPLDGKATGINAYTMNIPSEFYGYGQNYDAPQPIVVEGFCFYGWVNGAATDTAIVHCSIWTAAADSTPMTMLATTDVVVDNSYDANDLEVLKYCVTFPSPVTVTSQYIITIQTETTQPLGIISNDANSNDGAGEKLSYWRWTGDSTWYQNDDFFAWDCDWLLHPIVKYEYMANYTANADSLCVGDTLVVTNNSSPILQHRMYNKAANNGVANQSYDWDFGDGNTVSDVMDTSHVYTTGGDFTVTLTDSLIGWTIVCADAYSMTVHVDSMPAAAFAVSTNIADAMFTDNSAYPDTWLWEFGDGNVSSMQNPTHTYAADGVYTVQLIVTNNCGADTVTQQVTIFGVGVTENTLTDANISVFPNPTSGAFNVGNASGQDLVLKVYNPIGELVRDIQINTQQTVVDLPELSDGIYMLHFMANNGTLVKKLKVVR